METSDSTVVDDEEIVVASLGSVVEVVGASVVVVVVDCIQRRVAQLFNWPIINVARVL